ncbi:hypothetical protein [Leucobacter luti]|uniref:hypothetical protein n=1 Tax=Leucobacter luti TaxID=340320 RepID=UPI003D044E81
MGQPIYATRDDLREFIGADAPATITGAGLRAASEVVDEILLTAVYAVDEHEIATDPKVRDAIKDATCAQAIHADEYGDEAEIAADGEAVSLGPLTLGGSRTARGAGSSSGISHYSPRAVRILRAAGLVVGPVLT